MSFHLIYCRGQTLWCIYLLALSVSPRDPATAIATVLDLVHLGELITHASRVTTLGAHERDKVEGAQVNLEELLQVVWLHCYLRTPRAIALLKVQPGEINGGRKTNNSRCAH